MADVEEFRNKLVETQGNIVGEEKRKVLFQAIAELRSDEGKVIGPVYAPIELRSGRKSVTVDGYDVNQGCLKLISLIDCNPRAGMDQVWNNNTCKSDEVRRISTCLYNVFADLGALRRQLPEDNKLAELILGNKLPSRIELEIWTNGKASRTLPKVISEMRLPTDVVDTEALEEILNSAPDMPEVNFEEDYGVVRVFLEDDRVVDGQGGASARAISVLLGKIGGNLLADLYKDHRSKLLQQNIRSFLKCTGQVNKGMLETIRETPGDFLSFNNGISATATEVKLGKVSDGVYTLRSAKDFQIVNGGQTTATLMVAKCQKGLELAKVQVAMKLTVVDLDVRPDIVSKIAKFSNNQNRIQNADFHANKLWFSKLQAISRKSQSNGTRRTEGHKIHWYFERTRGQYDQDLVAKSTPAKRRIFPKENPKWAKFDKLDLAMVMMAWDLRPFESALGPQKCFTKFLGFFPDPPKGVEVDPRGSLPDPTEELFKRVCFLLDIWRYGTEIAKREIRDNEIPYKTVGAYMLALLGNETGSRLPLDDFWRKQEIPREIKEVFPRLARECRGAIDESFEGLDMPNKKISEHVKKKRCWEDICTKVKKPFEPLTPSEAWDRLSVGDMFTAIATSGSEPGGREPPNEPEKEGPLRLPDPHAILGKLDAPDWAQIRDLLPSLPAKKNQLDFVRRVAGNVEIVAPFDNKELTLAASVLLLVRKNHGCPSVMEKINPLDWKALESVVPGG